VSLFRSGCATYQQVAQLQGTADLIFLQDKQILAALNTLTAQGAQLMDSNAQFLTDISNLTLVVAANTTAIQGVQTLVTADTETIASLNQQIADLKAANPALDLTGLEADITSLGANNVTAQSIVSSVPPPPPPAGGPPSAQ
jgi:hypothetical protein